MNTYTPTNWINGETAINQTNLNHIEQGISNNNSAILDLANGMKFKGTISSLPVEDLEIGNVYQASERIVVNNKLCDVGDLIVYVSTNTWHVIPSGDENDGTVTQISTGTGLTGGPIRQAGTINVDTSYINSLISQNLGGLSPLASSGSWYDLQNIPTSATRPMEQNTGDSQVAVMSQKAITDELNTKSDVGHIHTVSDIEELSSLLATDGVDNVRAASDTHVHGNITNDGRMNGVSGTRTWLCTDSLGSIVSAQNIPSTAINGTSFGAGINSVNITQSRNYLRLLYGYPDNSSIDEYIGEIDWNSIERQLAPPLEGILPLDEETNLLIPVAAEEHTHDTFTNTEDGFVPAVNGETGGDHSYMLSDDGWVEMPDTLTYDDNKLVINEKNEFITWYTQQGSGEDIYFTTQGQLKVVVLETDPTEDENSTFEFQDDCLYLIKG